MKNWDDELLRDSFRNDYPNSHQKGLQLESLSFEWDERKNESNIKKHGIYFEIAEHFFFEKYLIEIYDEEHSDCNEDRYIAIGRVEDVLYVVYTDKESSIRLISARLAEPDEEKLYYAKKNNRL